MKPLLTPAPNPPPCVRDLIRSAQLRLAKLTEGVALAALDSAVLRQLADALAVADDHANRLAAEYPVGPGRLSRVAGTTHPRVRPDFPLRPHNSGKWVKWIDHRAVYFGKLSDPAGAEQQYLAFLAQRLARARRAAGEIAIAEPTQGSAVA